jgi:hypothetical protein
MPFLFVIAPLILLIQGYYLVAAIWTIALVGIGFVYCRFLRAY